MIVQRFESLSRFLAGSKRLHELIRKFEILQLEKSPAFSQNRESDSDQDFNGEALLNVEDVLIRAPHNNTLLLKNCSFSLNRNDSLLIVGASGRGKSSLL